MNLINLESEMKLFFLIAPCLYFVNLLISSLFVSKYDDGIYKKSVLVWFFYFSISFSQVLLGEFFHASLIIKAVAFSFCSFFVMNFVASMLSELFGVKSKTKLNSIVYVASATISMALYKNIESDNWSLFPLMFGTAFPVLRLVSLIMDYKKISFTKNGFFICSFLTAIHILDYAFAFDKPDLVFPGYLVALILSTGISCFSFAVLIERAIYEVEVKDLLHNTSRLVAIGGMASEIAHEINNPLSVLSLNNSLVRQRLQTGMLDPDFLAKKIEVSERMTDRLLKIVHGLKSSYRSADKDEFKVVRLKDIFEDARILCEMRANKLNIDLVISKVSEDITIECRSVQIVQIIQNIVYNAFDALEASPSKWVSISYEQNTPGKIQIIIKDSGPGISKEHQEKIFSSFYTTKTNGKGTGLGLSISKRFSEEHCGHLRLDANRPETTFVLELPIVQPKDPKPLRYYRVS